MQTKINEIIAALMLLAALTAHSQIQMEYHPCRMVGGKYYSLQPIYNWLRLPYSDRTPRPMQEWIGVTTQHPYGIDYRVDEIVPEGVLLSSSGELLYGEEADYDSQEPILLKHYPKKDTLTDGKRITFLAIRAGTYQYTGTDGATHTIAAYDYGIPCESIPPTAEQIEAAKKRNERDVFERREIQEKLIQQLKTNATNGDSSAQFSLGAHYLHGIGCETNRVEAIFWFSKSAAQGDMDASNELSELQAPTAEK